MSQSCWHGGKQPSNAASPRSAEEFKAFWLLYLAVIAAEHVLPATKEENQNQLFEKKATKLLRSLRRDNTLPKAGWFQRTVSWFTRRFGRTVKFGVGPITIESDFSASADANQTFDVYQFLRDTCLCLTQQGRMFLIVLDQIDEVYKYEREKQEPFVQGLFLAERFITEDLNGPFRVIVLLRTDLFRLYDLQEKNKLQSRMEILQWTERDLEELLLRRLFHNRQLAPLRELFGLSDYQNRPICFAALQVCFPLTVEGLPFKTWFFKSLRNGNGDVSPRQIILFLIKVRGVAEKHRSLCTSLPLFSERDVSTAMTHVSRLSYDEIVSDFRVARNFVRNCRADKLHEFDINSVRQLFDDSEGSVNDQLEALERLGFVERIVLTDGGSKESRFRIPSLFTRFWDDAIK